MLRPIPLAIADLGIEEMYTIDAEFRPGEDGAYTKYGLSPELAPDELEPVCISWKRWTTGEVRTAWYQPSSPCPIPISNRSAVICFQAPAEWSYFLAAGWELPTNIVDLYAEHRRAINGEYEASGRRVGQGDHKSADGRTKYGLLSACEYWGLGSRSGTEKRSVVTRILAGPPFTGSEQQTIESYNRDDVEDTEKIFSSMLSRSVLNNFGQVLLRGDATRGYAVRDLNGLPVDGPLVERLQRHWETIRSTLAHIVEDQNHYDVFRFDSDGEAHFDQRKMAELVERLGMQDIWPRTAEGRFSFADPERGHDEDRPFKQMAQLNPYLEDLRQTKRLLEKFMTFSFPIGTDGRCHGRYAPWVQVTGRSSPGQGSIFAMPAWTRWLIRAGAGRGVANVDLRSAEFGVGAALSHDPNAMQDYVDMISGKTECVYLELARRAGQVPPDAKLAEYPAVRKLWKTACLAMMFGQSPEGLSKSAGISLSLARVIQDAFRARYSTYWAWTHREIVHAHARGWIETVCGWRMAVVPDKTKDSTLLNFHMQATCADIMRRAVALMADVGILHSNFTRIRERM